MDFAYYSIALIVTYAIVRYITENTSFHLKFKGLWIHHWILATIGMLVAIYLELDYPTLWGALTGIALEGLPRKIGRYATKNDIFKQSMVILC